MNRISYNYYEFLCELGIPYEGEVIGVGEAYCQPVVTPRKVPEDEAISHGLFLSTQYVSTLAPSQKAYHSALTDLIYEKLVHQQADGSIDFWDIQKNRFRKFDKTAQIKITTKGDRVNIEVWDDKGNEYSLENYHLDLLAADLENLYIPTVSKSKLIIDGLSEGVALRKYHYQGLKNSEINHTAWQYKKVLKKIGIRIKNKTSGVAKEFIPNVQKQAGKVMFVASAYLMYRDTNSSGGIRVSHAIDAAFLGISLFPGGWMIGLTYYAIDLYIIYVTKTVTGHGKSIGDFINEWVDESFGIEKGLLIDYNK